MSNYFIMSGGRVNPCLHDNGDVTQHQKYVILYPIQITHVYQKKGILPKLFEFEVRLS